jgi:hypothetical protein
VANAGEISAGVIEMWKIRGRRPVASLVAVVIVAGVLVADGADPAHALPLLGSPTLSSISVSPAVASVTQGQSLPFTATGLLSNGTTEDLTNLVAWSSSSGLLASLSNVTGSQGLATGLLPGVSTITATAPTGLLGLGGLLGGVLGGGLSGTAALTVVHAALSPVLTAISVSPSVASIAQGQTQQFTATGLMSDLSTENLTSLVTWSSSSALTTLGSQGLATGVLPGVSTITATAPVGLLGSLLGSILSSSSVLTVISGTTPTSPLPLLTLTPGSGRVRTGIIANGTNFVPGDPVTVTYLSGLRAHKRARTVLCTTTVASNGTFSCGAKIPPRVRSGKRGNHTIVATLPSSTQGTSTIFNLLR